MVKHIPVSSSKCFHAHLCSKPFYECKYFKFNYCSVIGNLNYMTQTSQADIIQAIHQFARFSEDPREERVVPMMYLCMYMNKKWLLRLCFNPDPSKGFKCYADANFAAVLSVTLPPWTQYHQIIFWLVWILWGMSHHMVLKVTVIGSTKHYQGRVPCFV